MKKTYVTSPYLPPIEEFYDYLKIIWNNRQLTNNGPLHQQFERELSNYLGVKHVSLVNSATSGLMIALEALGAKGEIITTPFSFIATSHVIKWNGSIPIFVDTDKNFGNIDTSLLEKKITSSTKGILAVHNYGIPGDLKAMNKISNKLSIPLIYDAAPGMGVKVGEKSLLEYGDCSVVSFHATKVFTTFEGGAIISKTKSQKEKIDKIKNFGIESETKVKYYGINGKMSEFNAALGILQLKYVDQIIDMRKKVYTSYRQLINKNAPCRLLKIPEHISYNYAYCAIEFIDGFKMREKAYKYLKQKNIITRKYWYPLISEQNIYDLSKNKNSLRNAKKLSERVLFLPIFPDLDESTIVYISNILNNLKP